MNDLVKKWFPLLHAHKLLSGRNPNLENYSDREREIVLDFVATHDMMKWSQTILCPNDVFMQLLKNIDRIDTRGEIYLPFPWILIQFEEPIPETLVMAHKEIIGETWEENPKFPEWRNPNLHGEDLVEALLIGNPKLDPLFDQKIPMAEKRSAIALFTSSSVNRIAWVPNYSGDSEPWWHHEPVGIKQEQLDNKKRLIKLSYLFSLFLNAPNVLLQRQGPPRRVVERRARKGLKKLPEYHIVKILHTSYEYDGPTRKGTEHGHMYPVRGHFRKLKQYDNPIWIPNHYRGVRHGEGSIPKELYKVTNPKKLDQS